MNLDELRSVQAKERRKDSLQHLRDSFYDDVAAYLIDLRAARDRRAAQVENPFSDDDVRRMSDEIETGEEVAEAIYERRVGKVVKLASFAAADMSVDVEGLTAEERRLFDDLVERIGRNKSTVLDVLTGVTADATGESPVSSSATIAEPATDNNDTRDEPSGGTTDDIPGSTTDDTTGGTTDDIPGSTTDDTTGGTIDDTTDATAGQTETIREQIDTDADSNKSSGTDPSDTEQNRQSTENSAPHRDSDGSSDPLTDAMGATESETATTVDPEPAPPGAMGVENDATANADATASPDAATESIQRTTVRITTDVGAILGVDEREYDLSKEDVVSLPEANAAPLIERDAAERID